MAFYKKGGLSIQMVTKTCSIAKNVWGFPLLPYYTSPLFVQGVISCDVIILCGTYRYNPFQRNRRFSIQRDGLVFARWAEYCENVGIPVSYLNGVVIVIVNHPPRRVTRIETQRVYDTLPPISHLVVAMKSYHLIVATVVACEVAAMSG